MAKLWCSRCQLRTCSASSPAVQNRCPLPGRAGQRVPGRHRVWHSQPFARRWRGWGRPGWRRLRAGRLARRSRNAPGLAGVRSDASCPRPAQAVSAGRVMPTIRGSKGATQGRDANPQSLDAGQTVRRSRTGSRTAKPPMASTTFVAPYPWEMRCGGHRTSTSERDRLPGSHCSSCTHGRRSAPSAGSRPCIRSTWRTCRSARFA